MMVATTLFMMPLTLIHILVQTRTKARKIAAPMHPPKSYRPLMAIMNMTYLRLMRSDSVMSETLCSSRVYKYLHIGTDT